MSATDRIDPEEHARQIRLYTEERPAYALFADSLKAALERARAVAIPEALVQARAKTVSSFAEKCVRKYAKYRDPVHQLTDLCGARVIVQTLEQVEAVKLFVEANFAIHERDEKGTRLGEDRFGYRDMHYILSLRPDRIDVLGISPAIAERIGGRKAELQVRTWLQHGWADTLHDRVYKSPLPLAAETKRTGNLLAALMEEGDRDFDTMAQDIDGLTANYAAFASKENVAEEIAVQQLILRNEPSPDKKPAIALGLARLLAAGGDYHGVAELLAPYREVADANQSELLAMLGCSLCRLHRSAPESEQYRDGCDRLRQAVALCEDTDFRFVPNLRKRAGLHARALAHLAWAMEVVPRRRSEAMELWQRAHAREPANPYYLAGMLVFEAIHDNYAGMAATMRVAVTRAIETCHAHVASGTEMPQACFTAGRLGLLLGGDADPLACYARGICHIFADTHCLPPDLLKDEMATVSQLVDSVTDKDLQPTVQWAYDLLEMAAELLPCPEESPPASPPKAIIVSGGAASLGPADIERFRPLLAAALAPFAGTVVSGGTAVGVPGCVGDVTAALRAEGACGYRLVGYAPRMRPDDAPLHAAYESIAIGESRFSVEQVLQGWRDLLDTGVLPRDVLCLGFGGGPISALEYRIALALGAVVAIVPAGDDDATSRIATDPLWSDRPNLLRLPTDASTVRALVVAPSADYAPEVLEGMARSFHARYVAGAASRYPANMRPWPELAETYRTANLEQARYAVEILKACGFVVRPAPDPASPAIFSDFTEEEIERMAEMEHGRWNVERLRNGWRLGPRDDARRLHPNIVPWSELPDGQGGVKRYDREGVGAFPAILAQAGLEVCRP